MPIGNTWLITKVGEIIKIILRIGKQLFTQNLPETQQMHTESSSQDVRIN